MRLTLSLMSARGECSAPSTFTCIGINIINIVLTVILSSEILIVVCSISSIANTSNICTIYIIICTICIICSMWITSYTNCMNYIPIIFSHVLSSTFVL